MTSSLTLAERDKLTTSACWNDRSTRMLADPRANTLVSNFVAQWLYLRNVEAVLPDMRGAPPRRSRPARESPERDPPESKSFRSHS